ncbi:hypothetical protein [Agromyces lapidis]|uniref:Uncharacterized protein n=1 Tax=Agromyces lapidis TaxID=279574 RepID=A0ABV5SMD8_9MICO|nr:hypothetical protein [Agromyces lapidis]
MMFKDRPAPRVDLDLPNCFHSGAFKSKLDPTDASEEREHVHVAHICLSSGLAGFSLCFELSSAFVFVVADCFALP